MGETKKRERCTRLTINTSEGDYERLTALAQATELSAAALVRLAVRRFLREPRLDFLEPTDPAR